MLICIPSGRLALVELGPGDWDKSLGSTAYSGKLMKDWLPLLISGDPGPCVLMTRET